MSTDHLSIVAVDAKPTRPEIAAVDMQRSFALMAEAARLSATAHRLRANAFELRQYDPSMAAAATGFANSYDAEHAALIECLETFK
jgi:hypothetical protein